MEDGWRIRASDQTENAILIYYVDVCYTSW